MFFNSAIEALIKRSSIGLITLIIALSGLSCYASSKQWEGPYWSDETANPWYLGGGLGVSSLDPSDQYSDWVIQDDEDSGYKVFLGRRFSEQWSFELAYLEPGSALLSNTDVSISEQAEIDYRIPAVTINYYFREPNSYWNFYAKGGVAVIRNDLNQEVSAGLINPPKRNTTEAAFGLGLHWNISERGFMRLEADSYGSDSWFVSLQLGVYFEGSK